MKRFRFSLINAIRGFKYVLKNERNFQIELIFAILVLVLMLVFDMSAWERILIIFMMSWVLAAELINTVVERISDLLKPRIHPYARLIKDIMAAAVLVSAVASVLIGSIVFWPYFMELL